MSQQNEILSHLISGQSLTPFDALQQFGCFRLAARIRDLRDDGHDILTEIVEQGDKRWARYRLLAAAK
tara:strand:- start:4571 stop:4774 length:204 start_codon:yes stop_codon:yes gene_type:complete